MLKHGFSQRIEAFFNKLYEILKIFLKNDWKWEIHFIIFLFLVLHKMNSNKIKNPTFDIDSLYRMYEYNLYIFTRNEHFLSHIYAWDVEERVFITILPKTVSYYLLSGTCNSRRFSVTCLPEKPFSKHYYICNKIAVSFKALNGCGRTCINGLVFMLDEHNLKWIRK